MAYEILNQELGVYSCSISDLTMGQVSSFLKQWNDGSTIGSLTVFYDSDGKIVINEDVKTFQDIKEIVVKYLQLSEDEKNELKESITIETFKSIFAVLDAALFYRKKKELNKLLGFQCTSWGTFNEITSLYDSYKPGCESLALVAIYNYGLIRGKQIERAKKKQHCEVTAC